jgi:hypothetical protein
MSCHGTRRRQPPRLGRARPPLSQRLAPGPFLARPALTGRILAYIHLEGVAGVTEVRGMQRMSRGGDGSGLRVRVSLPDAARAHSTHVQVERVLLLFEAAEVPTEHPLLGSPHATGPTASARAAAPLRFAPAPARRLSASSGFSPDAARSENP